MGENFVPKGSKPEWELIYSVLTGMQVGQVIDYDMLDAVLGRPFLDSRTPIYRARRELFATHGRLLANVSGTGYKVIKPDEHEGVARDHIRRGQRQISTATKIVKETPRNGMSPEGRRSLDDLQVHLVSVDQATRALNRRVAGRTPADDALDAIHAKEKPVDQPPQVVAAEAMAKVERLENLFAQFRPPV